MGNHVSTLHLVIEDDLARLLSQLGQPIEATAREILVLDLHRRGLISGGRAADLLSMSREQFIKLSSDAQIPYLRLSAQDWDSEVAESERI